MDNWTHGRTDTHVKVEQYSAEAESAILKAINTNIFGSEVSTNYILIWG